MILKRRAHARGAFLIGLAALVLVASTLSAAILLASGQTYSNSAQSVHRLEVLAAAEGAARLLLDDPLAENSSTTVGRVDIDFQPARETFYGVIVEVNATLAPNGGTAVRSDEFRVRYQSGDGGWFIASMERLE